MARRCVRLGSVTGNQLGALGFAEVRNGLWSEAIPTLEKAVALHEGADKTDFLILAMAYERKGDKAQAEQNFARATDLASKGGADDVTSKMLWAEAAEALGKPKPVS